MDDAPDADRAALDTAAAAVDADTITFNDLGLRPELLTALARLGYEEPTPIQRETIPIVLSGRDVVGQAATGTGKTAAFALPILHRLPEPEHGELPAPHALILVPTRELAVQVSEAMYKYGRDLRARVVPIYGGQPIGRQLHALRDGVHVVVATPGRALDHIRRGTLELDAVKLVVLDEADEMLDMGFAEDLEAILDAVPAQRQTLLFSATMAPRITAIAKRHLKDPVRIQIGRGSDGDSLANTPKIRQSAYVVQRAHKPAALGRILDVETPTAAIVFCRTRDEVDQLTETMNGRGYRAEALHGGLGQEQRDKVMARVRSGTTELLVATDVAARGLDIDSLTHVVNYDVPSAPEAYVHRIGRVGRAGRAGVAITLAEPREQRLLLNIERLTKRKIPIEKVPTVADLRAKQIEITSSTLREAAVADDLDDYASILDALTADLDQRQLVLAAIKLVHLATGATVDEREIPDASRRPERTDRPDRPDRPQRADRFERGGDRDARPSRGPERGGSRSGTTGLLYINLGRKAGIRPQDLVGAVANECGLTGRDIGPIRIAEHFSTVGVPEEDLDHAIRAMRSSVIKGKKATVRRFVESDRNER